jgi:hypothetical protein
VTFQNNVLGRESLKVDGRNNIRKLTKNINNSFVSCLKQDKEVFDKHS